MTSRLLTLGISVFVSLGILGYAAARKGAISLDSFSSSSVQRNTFPPELLERAVIEESTPNLKSDSPEVSPERLPSPASVIEVSDAQFDRLTSRGLVLVKFGADWCGPCRRIIPELEQLASDNQGLLTVLAVDIDRDKPLAKRNSVGSIPHVILFRDGKEVDSWVGYRSAREMQAAIETAKPLPPKGEVHANPFL